MFLSYVWVQEDSFDLSEMGCVIKIIKLLITVTFLIISHLFHIVQLILFFRQNNPFKTKIQYKSLFYFLKEKSYQTLPVPE